MVTIAMNKLFILIFLLLIMFPFVNAIEIYAGNESNILNIKICDGPIHIKVTSEEGIKDDELFLVNCDKLNNNYWDCYCNNSFDLIINTKNYTYNMYDFTVQYFVAFKKYIAYEDIPKNVSLSNEAEYEENKRTKKIIDVLVKPKERPKFNFKITAESKNTIVVGILIGVSIILFVFYKFKNAFKIKSVANYDVLNYKNTKDDALDDIFNQIK